MMGVDRRPVDRPCVYVYVKLKPNKADVQSRSLRPGRSMMRRIVASVSLPTSGGIFTRPTIFRLNVNRGPSEAPY
jgi:hypothetical protein